MPDPRAACLVVTRNSAAVIGDCLASVEADLGSTAAELLVVDTGSRDGTPELVAGRHPRWRLVPAPPETCFAGANNLGLGLTRAPLVLLLNPDVIVRPGCLPRLLAALEEDPRLGAVGPLKRNLDGSVQPSWGRFPRVRHELLRQTRLDLLLPLPLPRGRRLTWGQAALLDHRRRREVDWVTGSGLALRRSALPEPPFPEGYYLYREEVLLCRELRRRGWRTAFLPEAELVHLMGGSVAQEPSRATRLRVRGEILYHEVHGRALERELARLLALAGCLGRAAVAALLAAGGGGARRRRQAGAQLGAARELALLLAGRLDAARLIASPAGGGGER